ncbi:MAG: hypothetical protein WBP58_13850 [Chitinophagaceae bacterium]
MVMVLALDDVLACKAEMVTLVVPVPDEGLTSMIPLGDTVMVHDPLVVMLKVLVDPTAPSSLILFALSVRELSAVGSFLEHPKIKSRSSSGVYFMKSQL